MVEWYEKVVGTDAGVVVMISLTGAMVGMKWLLVIVGYFAVTWLSWSKELNLGVVLVVLRELNTWLVTLDAEDRYLSVVDTEFGVIVTWGKCSDGLL